MPGVVVTTATRSGPSAPVRATSGQYFVSGLTERGDTDKAQKVRSLADYRRLFGDRVTYGFLYDDLSTFFEEGGTQAYVARVVGPAATVGTLTLNDRAGVPVATLRVDAANEGAWSTRLTVEVRDGTNPNTFRLIFRLDGEVVHDVNNIASPADAPALFTTSPFVRLVNLGSATAPPGNNPAVRAATALSAGSDDRAAVTATILTDALGRFDIGLGDGAVAVPGYNTAVHAGVISHARTNRRIALLAAARGADQGALQTVSTGLASEYAGLFAPHILVPDGSGGTRAIEPVGFVAAKRNVAHETVGPWRAPAGVAGIANFVAGLDQEFSRTVNDDLDAARVSIIRRVGTGVRLYGWRSLSQDEANYSLLTGRDMLNRLVVEAEKRLEVYVFQPIDGRGQLLGRIKGDLIGMVEPLRVAGGLFERLDDEGNRIDPGYAVNVGADLNTVESLARNEVKAQLAVRISPAAALVTLTIVKVGVTAVV